MPLDVCVCVCVVLCVYKERKRDRGERFENQRLFILVIFLYDVK